MEHPEKEFTEKESLALIAKMINKAKDSFHDTGISAMLWGVVIAVCSLEKLAELQFSYKLPFDVYLLTFVALIPQIFISIKEKRKRKVKSYDDAYMDNIWLAFGITIFLMILITSHISTDMQPVLKQYSDGSRGRTDWTEFSFSEYVESFFLLLYGFPTFVTGAACKFKPMFWGGLLCWVSCIIALYTPLKIDLLLTAFSAIFAWLVPGIIMEQDYRKAKQELAQAHV